MATVVTSVFAQDREGASFTREEQHLRRQKETKERAPLARRRESDPLIPVPEPRVRGSSFTDRVNRVRGVVDFDENSVKGSSSR